MFQRFEGEGGLRLRVEALADQRIVGGNSTLAEELAGRVQVRQVSTGEHLIEQDGSDNQMYFILSGTFSIIINGRLVARRGAGNHVGEMAAVEPTQRRSATVIADEAAVVAELSEEAFSEIAGRYPTMYRYIARELSRRLMERNKLVAATREKIRVFIISSAEALPIARVVQNAFQHDQFTTTLWTDGVFKVAHYPLDSLEAAVDSSDFAIAIAHADDVTESRGKDWPTPRDNVIFELGLFLGRLGRMRAILMEPREAKVRLPSDLTGVTTIPYRFEKGEDMAALLAPACNDLRNHIVSLGPNN